MQTTIQTPVQFLLLTPDNITDAFFADLLAYARAHRSEPAVKQLEQVVNSKKPAINGFSRSPFQAIMTPRIKDLAAALPYYFYNDAMTMLTVLDVWMDANAELEAAVRACCAELQIDVAAESDYTCVPAPERGLVARLIRAVEARCPSVHPQLAAMMIAILTGLREPPAEDDQAQPDDASEPAVSPSAALAPFAPAGLEPSCWPALLAWLHAAPATSGLWEQPDAIAVFQAGLAHLAEVRQRERQGTVRVAAALERLRCELAEPIADLDLSDIAAWDAARCPIDLTDSIVARIDELYSLIAQWRDIGPAPKPPRERNRWLAQQQALEATIGELYLRIAAQLGTVTPSPGDDSPGEGGTTPAASETTEEQPAAPAEQPIINAAAEAAPAAPAEPPAASATDDRLRVAAIADVQAAEPALVGAPFAERVPASPVSVGAADPPAKPEIVEDTFVAPAEQPAAIETAAEALATPEPATTSDEPAPDATVAETAFATDADSPTETPRSELVWTLIGEDDLGGAYWVARAIAEDGEAPLSLDLLQVLAGTQALEAEPNNDALIADIAAIASRYQPIERPDEQLLGLAASLSAVLRAPASGLLEWVDAPDPYPSLHELAAVVREAAIQGLLLRDEELRGLADQQQLNDAIGSAVAQARGWMDEAPARRTGYARASNVWRELVSSRGELYNLMAAVRADRREQVHEVRQRARVWRDRGYALEQIHKLDRAVSKSGATPIVGDARDQLLRDIADACDRLEQWCTQVEREQQARGHDSSWLLGKTRALRDRVEALLPDAHRGLVQLEDAGATPGLRAAARVLHRRLASLVAPLGLAVEAAPASRRSAQWQSLAGATSEASSARGLAAALGRRLWTLPGVAIGDDGQATAESLPGLPAMLHDLRAREVEVEELIRLWRRFGDYRWIEALRSLLPDTPRTAELHRETQDALQAAVANLKRQIDEVREPLAMAVFAGDLDDDVRTRLEGMLEQIDPARTRNFALARQQLALVESEVALQHERRVNDLAERWRERRLDLAAVLGDAEEVERIVTSVDRAIAGRNTWEINEALARVERSIGGGVSDTPRERGDEPQGDALRSAQQRFFDQQEQVEQALRANLATVIATVRNRGAVGGIDFAQRPESAFRALEAWRALAGAGVQMPASSLAANLKEVLEFIGFESVVVKSDEAQAGGRREGRMPSVSMGLPTGRGRPLPQISGAPARQYDLLVLWDSGESLRTQLQRVTVRGAQPLILIYLSALNSTIRRDVTRQSRERPLLVLDTVTLLALAAEQERDTRFKLWLQYCLPYTTINPYVPHAAGNVPAEIFYGRHDELRTLEDPNGSCLVYGGRQLGKSALLTAVKRRFHHPERKQYAWVENIDLIGDVEVNQPASDLWEKIRLIFRDHLGLIRPFKAEKPDEIARTVGQHMQRNPETRVLLLFDEADDFLDHDAEGRFQVVVELRKLMQETNRRFKVVFTGLHDVQRFAAIPNQPLAHFGKPICIGPLPPAPARDLVVQPLEALGFRFADEALVLRILSYTNYHAGLLQIFCHELLQRVQRTGAPPFQITQRDVDAAYLSVRGSIRDRFELTLNLDPRYRAIALSLIEDQLTASNGFARAYHASMALSLAQSWWPAGFEETSTDEAQGLLDEMCGLGVLIRTIDGAYRLRSPNLVRLLGSAADVLHDLDQLTKSRPPTRLERDTYHMPLGGVGRTFYSPLTHAQERALQLSTTPVSVVFGSERTGIGLLPTVLEQLGSGDPTQLGERVLRVATSASNAYTLGSWLKAEIERHNKYERLTFVCQPTSGGPADLAALVSDTVTLCRKRDRRPDVRVIFLFGAAQTIAWMQLPPAERDAIERKLLVLSLQRWTAAAVGKRLRLAELNDGDEDVADVLRVTGNWQLLLDALCERAAQLGNLRLALTQVDAELRAPAEQGGLRARFEQALAHNNELQPALDAIAENASGRVELNDFLDYLQQLAGIPQERGEQLIVALERLALIDRQERDLVLAPLARVATEMPDDQ